MTLVFLDGEMNSPTSAASRNGFATCAFPLSVNSCISQRGTSTVDASLAAGTEPSRISSRVVRNAMAKDAPAARTSATELFHQGISQPHTRVPYFFIVYWCGFPSDNGVRPNQLYFNGVASSFQR